MWRAECAADKGKWGKPKSWAVDRMIVCNKVRYLLITLISSGLMVLEDQNKPCSPLALCLTTE